MKKLVAMMLALAMVLAMTAALADDANITGYVDPDNKTSNVDNGGTFVLTKTLTVTNDDTLFPAGALTFSVAKGNAYGDEDKTVSITNPDGAAVSLEAYTEGAEDADLTVTLPTYTEPGIYYYTITETSTTAGVTVMPSPLCMKVTVIQDPAETDSKQLMVAGIAIREGEGEVDEGTKIDEIDNTFDAGTLEVEKIITGNAADLASTWDFTVTFANPQGKTSLSTITYTVAGGAEQTIAAADLTTPVTFTLGHQDKAIFTNIPYGVTYSIVETDANKDGYTTDRATSDAPVTGSIAAASKTETVTNSKSVDVDTGITLESVPYIMIMMIAMAGAAMMIARKRREEV